MRNILLCSVVFFTACGNLAEPDIVANTVEVTSGLPPVPALTWEGSKSTRIGVSVAVASFDLGALPNFPQFRPFADVLWGVREAPSAARIDVGLGAQFTVSGRYVALSLGAETSTVPASAVINAWATLGLPGIESKSVTRTLFFTGIILESPPQPIPAFVTRLRAVWCSQDVKPLGILFRDADGIITVVHNVDCFGTEPVDLHDESIPNGAYSVSITSPIKVQVQLVFELGL